MCRGDRSWATSETDDGQRQPNVPQGPTQGQRWIVSGQPRLMLLDVTGHCRLVAGSVENNKYRCSTSM